jgi:hypothetical protein
VGDSANALAAAAAIRRVESVLSFMVFILGNHQ